MAGSRGSEVGSVNKQIMADGIDTSTRNTKLEKMLSNFLKNSKLWAFTSLGGPGILNGVFRTIQSTINFSSSGISLKYIYAK